MTVNSAVRSLRCINVLLILLILLIPFLLLDSERNILKNFTACNKILGDNTLIFNNGEKFRNIVIVTKARSGSTFTLHLLSQNSEVFYTFEPVSEYMMRRTNSYFNGTIEKANIIKNILDCDFKREQNYNSERLNRNKVIENWFKNCLKNTSVYDCKSQKLDVYEKWCKSSNFHVMKTMLPFKGIDYLINQNKLNLSIIHLVRDPRAIISSRKTLKRKNPRTAISDNLTNLCSEMQEDLDQADLLKNQYK